MRPSIAASIAIAVFTAATPVVAADDGSRPGDDALTCQQIATQPMPYMAQMNMGEMTAMGQNAQEMARRAKAREAEMEANAAADTAETEAGCVGGVNATCAASSAAADARHRAQNERYCAEDKPITDQMSTQMGDLAAQGQAMQNDPRLVRLMALAQQKHCH